MLGDIIQLADNLWMIEGEMPEDANNAPDPANVLVYQAEERLYMIDSGVGDKMRQSIEQLIDEIGSVQIFTLLHSHSHLDHVCNNDLLQRVVAQEKHHYLSEAGWTGLDTHTYFANHFMALETYYDPFSGYQAHRLKFRMAGIMRDLPRANETSRVVLYPGSGGYHTTVAHPGYQTPATPHYGYTQPAPPMYPHERPVQYDPYPYEYVRVIQYRETYQSQCPTQPTYPYEHGAYPAYDYGTPHYQYEYNAPYYQHAPEWTHHGYNVSPYQMPIHHGHAYHR